MGILPSCSHDSINVRLLHLDFKKMLIKKTFTSHNFIGEELGTICSGLCGLLSSMKWFRGTWACGSVNFWQKYASKINLCILSVFLFFFKQFLWEFMLFFSSQKHAWHFFLKWPGVPPRFLLIVLLFILCHFRFFLKAFFFKDAFVQLLFSFTALNCIFQSHSPYFLWCQNDEDTNTISEKKHSFFPIDFLKLLWLMKDNSLSRAFHQLSFAFGNLIQVTFSVILLNFVWVDKQRDLGYYGACPDAGSLQSIYLLIWDLCFCWFRHLMLVWWIHIPFTLAATPLQAGCDIKSIFKRSTAGLNSAFFCLTGYFARGKELSQPHYLPIAERRTDRFMLFPKVLGWGISTTASYVHE